MPDIGTRWPSDLVRLVASDGSSAVVHPYGAQVLSWRTGDGEERLYLSARTATDGPGAIRGGVPVIFPQFASEGPLQKHGFARVTRWTVASAAPTGARPTVTLELRDSRYTRTIWPHPFAAWLRVTLRPAALEIQLEVHNSGIGPLSFTAALHTYLRVADAARTLLQGLAGARYRDAAVGGVEQTGDDAPIPARGELNRTYFDVAHPVDVVEPRGAMRVSMRGFADVVVWNPGSAGEGALGDMEPGGADHMVCVEAARIGRPVTLAPGARWSGSQTLAITR